MRTIDRETSMRALQDAAAAAPLAPRRPALGTVARFLLHGVSLLVGVAAFVAHEHYALQGDATASMATLVAAAGFGLLPLRALLHAVFAIEGKILHVAHGLGSLSFVALTLGGAVSGKTLMPQAAMAPFAIMGAAQAIMHQGHPRNAEQASALQRFATSLPELEAFTKGGDLSSPANARRAVVVLTDLVTKAQALGETELRADPEFQSALRAAPTRIGLSLGLDAIDRAIGTLAANPATANAVPDLRRRLAAARKTVGR